VDEIKDDVAEIKADQKINSSHITDLKEAMKQYVDVTMKHVAGDEKIISEIAPIIEEFKYQQERKRRRAESMRYWGLKLGIPATVVAIIGGAVKIWVSF
jgi:hypothetical protein